MIWEKLRGHDEQVEMFRRSLQRGRLSHGYLFVGPSGVGKRSFARALAQCLFCERMADAELEACGECIGCRQMMAGTHPDYLPVGVPEGKSELPIDTFAGEPGRRGREGLCYELSLRPMAATRRIAVIDDAERMNAESSNALLKTLEEPPPFSMLILVAARSDDLLPTIRSRCQHVRFAPLPAEVLADLLLEHELAADRETALEAASLSEGSLETAARLLDADLRQLRETLYDHLAAEKFNGVRATEAVLSALEELGGDKQQQREHARWVVDFCVAFYRQLLRSLSSDSAEDVPVEQVRLLGERLAPASPEGLETVMALIERAARADEQLERRTPVPLCLEGLFDDLGRLMRTGAAA